MATADPNYQIMSNEEFAVASTAEECCTEACDYKKEKNEGETTVSFEL